MTEPVDRDGALSSFSSQLADLPSRQLELQDEIVGLCTAWNTVMALVNVALLKKCCIVANRYKQTLQDSR